MDTIFIARVIDGADFDAIVVTAAFARKCDAEAWLECYARPAAARGNEFARSLRTEVEAFDFVGPGLADAYGAVTG